MLRAFKERLKEMAADPKDPFNEIVRRRVGEALAPDLSVKLRNLTLLLPDMLGHIHAWSAAGRSNPEVLRISGDLLTYMYHPEDFIHDRQGLFGYVDDAFIAGLAYCEFLESMGHRRGVSPSIKEVRDMLAAARKVLPKECAEMTVLVEEMLKGGRSRFEAILKEKS